MFVGVWSKHVRICLESLRQSSEYFRKCPCCLRKDDFVAMSSSGKYAYRFFFMFFWLFCSGRGSLEVRKRRKVHVNIKSWDWFMRSTCGLYDCSELLKKLWRNETLTRIHHSVGSKMAASVSRSPLFSPLPTHISTRLCCVMCCFSWESLCLSACMFISVDFGEGLQIRRATLA